jgi:hypothetical protein
MGFYVVPMTAGAQGLKTMPAEVRFDEFFGTRF